jgi:hypothetical protein
MGRLHSTDDVKKMYSVDEVHYVDDVSNTVRSPQFRGSVLSCPKIISCSEMWFKPRNRNDMLLKAYRSNHLSLICPDDTYCVIKACWRFWLWLWERRGLEQEEETSTAIVTLCGRWFFAVWMVQDVDVALTDPLRKKMTAKRSKFVVRKYRKHHL